MTILEVICLVNRKIVSERKAELEKIKAPSILIDKCNLKIADCDALTLRVSGLARTHKVKDVAVDSFKVVETTGDYYKGGKKKTTVIKMQTAQGIYFYDYFSNKIGTYTANGNAIDLEVPFHKLDRI